MIQRCNSYLHETTLRCKILKFNTIRCWRENSPDSLYPLSLHLEIILLVDRAYLSQESKELHNEALMLR